MNIKIPVSIPAFANRRQVALELGVPYIRVNRAAAAKKISPDAVLSGNGEPLYLTSRLGELAQLLTKVEVLA
jgi:hypothetical protein